MSALSLQSPTKRSPRRLAISPTNRYHKANSTNDIINSAVKPIQVTSSLVRSYFRVICEGLIVRSEPSEKADLHLPKKYLLFGEVFEVSSVVSEKISNEDSSSYYELSEGGWVIFSLEKNRVKEDYIEIVSRDVYEEEKQYLRRGSNTASIITSWVCLLYDQFFGANVNKQNTSSCQTNKNSKENFLQIVAKEEKKSLARRKERFTDTENYLKKHPVMMNWALNVVLLNVVILQLISYIRNLYILKNSNQ